MARYRVVCVRKRGGHHNPHERISEIGIATVTGTSVQRQEQIIEWIETRRHSFYVMRVGKSVEVVVATRHGRKYLKTEADGVEPNNLLALQEC